MAPGSEVIPTQTLVRLHFISLDLFHNAKTTDLIAYNYIKRTYKHTMSLSTCMFTHTDARTPEQT